MKRVLIFIAIVLLFLITSCPTPFGILMGDSILHYNGDGETIEDWLKGDNPWIDDTPNDEEENVDVTIIVTWPWDD